MFRTLRAFAKITALFLTAHEPDGKRPEQRVEFLCDGQQIVVDGIHPETRQPYRCHGGCIGDIKRDDLPLISEDEARGLVADIVDLLTKEHGYRQVNAKGQPISAPGSTGNGQDNGPTDWATDADLIDHDLLCAEAMRMLKSGMNAGAVEQNLRTRVGALTGVDPERKQRRLDEIPNIVSSAEKKIGAGGDDCEDLGEWDAGDDPGVIEPRQWLLGNQFCPGFVSSLTGAGAVGKTSTRLLEFISMALGRSLGGLPGTVDAALAPPRSLACSRHARAAGDGGTSRSGSVAWNAPERG